MRIGILGGGQLAMMMIQESSKLDIEFLVVDPTDNPPASKYATHIRSEYNDKKTLDKLADCCDVITIDFENVQADALEYLESKKKVFPDSTSLKICQDRLEEKKLFLNNDVMTTEFKEINSIHDLRDAVVFLGTDTILKSRKFGYDGKNQTHMKGQNIDDVWKNNKGKPCILEKRIKYKTELSIIAVRTQKKNIFFYPLIENFHNGGILNFSVAPYLNDKLQKKAESISKKIMDSLDYTGVLVIEFFLDKNNNLIANEMAPRVHNSGHWTIEGCDLSQFQAHIGAIIGNEDLKPKVLKKCAMLNLLSELPNLNKLNQTKGISIYNYGKHERVNRKLGHITIVDSDANSLKKKLDYLRKIIF